MTAHSGFLLRARTDAQPPSLKGLSAQQRALDVVQLHKVVLEETLGMSEEDIRAQKHLKYIRDAGEAVDEVLKGTAQVAFLMNPVRMEQVRDIAFAGEVLPQKSTDFYPKMLSGLTIYSLAAMAAQGSSRTDGRLARLRNAGWHECNCAADSLKCPPVLRLCSASHCIYG